MCAITSGSRSSPAITSAGSPGNKCCREKIRIDTKNSVGISCRMRLARKFSMAFVSRARRSVPGSALRAARAQAPRSAAEPGSVLFGRWGPALRSSVRTLHRVRDTSNCLTSPPSLELQPGHADQSVRHLPVAFEPGGVGDQELAVIEIDERLIMKHESGELFVDRLALRRIGNQPRLFKQPVGLRVGIEALVLRRLGVQKD